MVITNTQKQVLLKAISKFGIKSQIVQSLEEFNELEKQLIYSLCRVERVDVLNISEEIADCVIMLNQLIEIFEIPDIQIQGFINLKIDNLSKKI